MDKGNIVKSNEHDTEGMVLALTKDGKRAKVYVLGSDGKEIWKSIDSMTVIIDGDETCWKCGGSGIYYGSGAVVNGVFQGTTGKCFGCGGNGKQDNADRVRNHYYWHREREIYDALDAIEKGETPAPLSHPVTGYVPEATPQNVKEWEEAVKPAVKPKIKSKKKNHPDPERKALGKPRGRRSHSGGAIPAVPVSNDDSAKLVDCKGCGTLHRDDTLCPW